MTIDLTPHLPSFIFGAVATLLIALWHMRQQHRDAKAALLRLHNAWIEAALNASITALAVPKEQDESDWWKQN